MVKKILYFFINIFRYALSKFKIFQKTNVKKLPYNVKLKGIDVEFPLIYKKYILEENFLYKKEILDFYVLGKVVDTLDIDQHTKLDFFIEFYHTLNYKLKDTPVIFYEKKHRKDVLCFNNRASKAIINKL
jgi:hypothetical protein